MASSSTSGGISSASALPVPVTMSGKRPANAGRKLGTLVVVVIKARNLPNKQRIGKQDPYCSITLGHQKGKTPAVKRGGQTPHWDAQLEFEVWEALGDEVPVVATDSGGIAPAAAAKDDDILPNQATVGRTRQKSDEEAAKAKKKTMKIACYADDPREPDLIGEAELDYAPTLKKGEFDEWVELKYRGKYAGEVFIEMTFYSAAPPPVKRKNKPPTVSAAGSGYGGPGHFEPLPVSMSFPQASPQSSSASLSSKPSSASTLTAGHFQASPSSHGRHPLRTSQSSYTLAPAPSPAPSHLSEFGARPASSNSLAFPTPGHLQHQPSTSSFGSQAPSHGHGAPVPSPSQQPHKMHRASFSSYGMTQHDIDSLTRPLSSLSIASVNKPLPLPSPHQVGFPVPDMPSHSQPHHNHQQQRPTSGLAHHRPHSSSLRGDSYAHPASQAHAQPAYGYQQPAPLPQPQPQAHTMQQPPPPLEHYHSQPVPLQHQHHPHQTPAADWQQPHQHAAPAPGAYADPHPDFPSNPHRHSLSTYLPPSQPADEPAYSNWNNAQIQHLPSDAPLDDRPLSSLSHGIGQGNGRAPSPYDPPHTPIAGGSRRGWQNPRAGSVNGHGHGHEAEPPGLSTSPRPMGYHPSSLQPGLLSPTRPDSGFPHSPPPPPHSSAGHHSGPLYQSMAQSYTPPLPPRSPVPQQHQQQAASYSPAPPVQQDYASQQQDPYYAQPQQQHVDPYQQHEPQQQYEQQPYHPPPAGQYPQYQDQPYEQQQQQIEQPYYAHDAAQQNQQQQRQHYASPTPPPLHVQQFQQQQQSDPYRSNSPYRPLPQPAPDQQPQPYQYHSQPQQPQQPQPYYGEHQQAPPLPQSQHGGDAFYPSQSQGQGHGYAPQQSQSQGYQPRFGLPPHQPYDPPYAGAPLPPPPVPPVPQALREEHHQQGRYGYY